MPLDRDTIESLIKWDQAQHLTYDKRVSTFDKNVTLQILNAVSDHKTKTEDGLWSIAYSRTRDNERERFFVRPSDHHYLPCGVFDVEDALTRLSL